MDKITNDNIKYTNISIIRLLSVISIVICHFLQYYNNDLAFVFNIGVQIFLIISAFLYAKKYELCDFKKSMKCCKKILFDLSIFLVLAVILIFIFQPIPPNLFEAFVLFNNFLGIAHLWYIPVILICYLLMPLLSKFINLINIHIKNDFLILIIVLVFFAVFYFCTLWLGYFAWMSCFVGTFLVVGCLKNSNKKFKIGLFISLVILSCLLHYFIYINRTINLFYFNKLARILISAVIFCSLFYILKPLNNRQGFYNGVLNASDKYSYDVYLTHQLFILGDLSILNHFINNKFVGIILTLIAILTLTVLLIVIKNFLLKFKSK